MKVEMINWITFCMGVFLLVVGIIIWAGKKIELVHGDDAYSVPQCDVAAYARLLGIGVILMSFAVISYGVLSSFPEIPPVFYWISVGTFGASGLLILIIGKKKYMPED